MHPLIFFNFQNRFIFQLTWPITLPGFKPRGLIPGFVADNFLISLATADMMQSQTNGFPVKLMEKAFQK